MRGKQNGLRFTADDLTEKGFRETTIGGKTINKIIADTGVKIDIEDDGRVFISTPDQEAADNKRRRRRSTRREDDE